VAIRGTILAVDDDAQMLRFLTRVLGEQGLACAAVSDPREAVDAARRTRPDAAIVDLAMPELDGLQVLRRLHELDAALPVLIITGRGGLDSAVEAIHMGAFDYLTKPIEVDRLRQTVARALEVRNAALRSPRQGGRGEPSGRARIVGRHPAMVDVFKLIGAVSQPGSRSTVLVLGETGVGKELVARAIHDSGETADLPFVTVQCAGVPETLIENELFGHERGAFTGAESQQPGRVEVAGNGTLFLDEIADLPPPIQAKILRLLETGEYERLGGATVRRATCRFVAATNRDLLEAVRGGEMREDLFFRLRVVTIRVPPLRERREDIPLLIDAFLDDIGGRQRRKLMVSPAALETLQRHSFPGNVRELRHVLEHAAALARGPIILPEHLPELEASEEQALSIPLVSAKLSEAREHVLRLFEREFLSKALRETRGNVTAAAARSGVRRQYLQRLLKRHGLDAADFRTRS
jgi:DNA-binding NtrC family response regulator